MQSPDQNRECEENVIYPIEAWEDDDTDWDRPLTEEEQASLRRLARDSIDRMLITSHEVVWANGEVETITRRVL
jgi:hypothetical protein